MVNCTSHFIYFWVFCFLQSFKLDTFLLSWNINILLWGVLCKFMWSIPNSWDLIVSHVISKYWEFVERAWIPWFFCFLCCRKVMALHLCSISRCYPTCMWVRGVMDGEGWGLRRLEYISLKQFWGYLMIFSQLIVITYCYNDKMCAAQNCFQTQNENKDPTLHLALYFKNLIVFFHFKTMYCCLLGLYWNTWCWREMFSELTLYTI